MGAGMWGRLTRNSCGSSRSGNGSPNRSSGRYERSWKRLRRRSDRPQSFSRCIFWRSCRGRSRPRRIHATYRALRHTRPMVSARAPLTSSPYIGLPTAAHHRKGNLLSRDMAWNRMRSFGAICVGSNRASEPELGSYRDERRDPHNQRGRGFFKPVEKTVYSTARQGEIPTFKVRSRHAPRVRESASRTRQPGLRESVPQSGRAIP